MLINFCDNYLQTDVKCDKPCSEGYDVKNLLLHSNPGFLAYSTIKPPINIDFHLVCNIKLSHILIWPLVGSQKSTGFKISTKCYGHQHYKILSSGFLETKHTGISFSTKYVNENSIVMPLNFLNARISHYHDNVVNGLDNIRITIIKTNKSVPAISKIEIWGYISSFNKLENHNKICNLLVTCKNVCYKEIEQLPTDSNNDGNPTTDTQITRYESLPIPEEYLDPITWIIMLQPIILPSGKIIDASTLENYGENEALWGRPLSDPFTGIILNKDYKPIFALHLKLKIDKFLSENSDHDEIRSFPRTLGHKSIINSFLYSRHYHQNVVDNHSKKRKSMNILTNSERNIKHKLPISSRQYLRNYPSMNINKNSGNVTTEKIILLQKLKNIEEPQSTVCNLDAELKSNLEIILSNLKRFNDINREAVNTNISENTCDCCESPIFYKLPCNHIVCRKFLLSHSNDNNKNNFVNLQCSQCNLKYKSGEVTLFHN